MAMAMASAMAMAMAKAMAMVMAMAMAMAIAMAMAMARSKVDCGGVRILQLHSEAPQEPASDHMKSHGVLLQAVHGSPEPIGKEAPSHTMEE